jgi:hypothetical protein
MTVMLSGGAGYIGLVETLHRNVRRAELRLQRTCTVRARVARSPLPVTARGSASKGTQNRVRSLPIVAVPDRTVPLLLWESQTARQKRPGQ